MKKILALVICLNIFAITYSQTQPSLPIIADSLATGNYKDALGSFFQLAFNKFIGPDKEVKFTSNPFAVMAKLDTSLLRDREYFKYRHLRDLNISFAAKLDTSYRFNGFASVVKYALINRRDETVSRIFIHDVLSNATTQDLFSMNLGLEQYISSFSTDIPKQDSLRAQKTKFFRGDINFDDLDNELQAEIKKEAKNKQLVHLSQMLAADSKFNIKKSAADIYNDIKERINNKLLWTVALSDTTYQDQFFFSNIVLSSELLKGIDKMKSKDIELNMKAAVQFTDDTSRSGRNLKRSVLSFEPGFNFILKNKQNLKSLFEFELSGSYYHTFSSLYANEKRDSLTLNGTLRLRIYNDIWIPLEIKYDPRSGNVLGFLNVRANFNALGRMLKS